MQQNGVVSLKVPNLELVIDPSAKPTLNVQRAEEEEPAERTLPKDPQEDLERRKQAQFFDLFGRQMTDEERVIYKDVPSFIM
jgi:hypothetical protein